MAAIPSPEVMLGQAWGCWVEAVKPHATDGIEPEESFKECVRNREAMRLCRDDMPIFGQCPAQDDFYLVMCSHCSQVVKPQAFQAHYERRHSSINKPASSYPSSTALPGHPSRARTGGTGGGGHVSAMPVGSSSSSSSSAGGSNNAHTAKEKMPHRKPHFPPKVLHDNILTPAVKVEKLHVKMDYTSSKPGHVPASSTSSSSCSTVSFSPSKPGLNSQSVPKAHQPSPGHMPNGKGHLSPLSKKQDSSSSTNTSSKRPTRKVLEREFNPDVHCGVLDIGARKPCTRSLTCKTHSLSQRRAVPGRRKRFDVLLAEHKNRAREKELLQQQHKTEPSHQTPPPLREPHPPLHHGNPTVAAMDAAKLFPLSKAKSHNPVLPRSSSSHAGLSSLGDAAATPEPNLHSHSAPAPDGAACPSSDEGDNEEREENIDKLDCHFSGYHPRPAAFCTFGNRLFGRGCHSFDRRWDQVRYALVAMMDKHVNSLMWKKIPLALENSSSSAFTSSHRSSANSLSSSSGFLSPSPPTPYSQSHDGKPTLSYGTTLNARVTSQRAGEQLTYSGGSSRQVSSSSPQMPSAHSSSLPSTPGSNKSVKSRSGTKHFWVKEPSPAALASSTANSNNNGGSSSDTGGASVSNSGGAISLGSTKKRKNSSLLKYGAESSPSSSSSSLKKNCTVNSGTSGSSFHSSLNSTSSVAYSSSSSSSSSHNAGTNCPPGRGNSTGARQEAAEPIKRMSVMMNSSDSTLSLGPFVNNPDGRTDSKRRKSSQATSSLTGTSTCTASAGGGGGGGAQGPSRPKMAKSPAINNIHGKHTRPMPGTPGLHNNSLIHQPKARP